MSSRQIRKLKQQREAEEARLRQEAEDAISEEESEEENFVPQAKPSMFSAFAGLEDEAGDDSDEDQDDKPESAPIAKVATPSGSDSDDEPLAAPAKKAKKSKKKKKKAAKTKATPKSESEQDIDAALAALNIKAQSSKTGAKEKEEQPPLDPEYERVCALLGINSQHLKVANEMRNLFGRTAVDNRDDDGAGTPRRGGRRQRAVEMDLEAVLKGRHAPGKGFPELTLRRNLFIAGKDEWPRAPTGGLTMEIVKWTTLVDSQTDGTSEFRFCHDQMYEQTQQQFRMFVEMGDPQNLISLLVRNPYNVSLLIQVSKIAKDQSDHSLSNDLLERALFTLARATTSSFANKLKEGKARMDFTRPENRELWLAGHQYIKSLIMKGTYRTALEWGKLLLALDPIDDPYCTHLFLHHLAYRAGEFEWLIDYANSSMMDPLSHTYYSVLPTKALAHMSLKQPKEARTALRESIIRSPFMFGLLFKELNLGDLPPSIWGAISLNSAEELFGELYVRQTKDLWNTPEATSLLMEVAFAVRKDEVDPFIYNSESVNLDVARFVYLDNTPALMSLIPTQLLHRQPNSDSDPLPPNMEDNKFSWPSQRQVFLQAEGGARNGLAGAMEGHFDPIQALRRLIPGFTGQEGREEEDERALQNVGLREALEREIAAGDAGETEDDNAPEDSGRRQERGTLRRLYELMFGGRNGGADGGHDSSDEDRLPGETDFQRSVRQERAGARETWEGIESRGITHMTEGESMAELAFRREGEPSEGDSDEFHSADEGEGFHSANEDFEEWDEAAFERAEQERREREGAER